MRTIKEFNADKRKGVVLDVRFGAGQEVYNFIVNATEKDFTMLDSVKFAFSCANAIHLMIKRMEKQMTQGGSEPASPMKAKAVTADTLDKLSSVVLYGIDALGFKSEVKE